MAADWTIAPIGREDPGTASAVLELLVQYNEPFMGRAALAPLQLAARDAEGTLIGGLLGEFRVHWLHVDILAVAEGWRRSGLGSALMAQAERRAREAECLGIWLDTFEFQAPRFYEKLGFTRCGTIRNYCHGHDRHIYEKRL